MTSGFGVKCRLPTLPTVALRLLDALPDPDVPIGEIVDIVESDPAMAAKLLKAANSPLYGPSRKVDDLDHAVVWLGKQTVACLTLNFHLSEMVVKTGYLEHHHKRYWLQSVIQALSMAHLAVERRLGPPGTFLATGLLMDIGRLALLQENMEQYLPVVEQADLGLRSLREIEAEILGITHAELSAVLMEDWSLPENLIAVARHHELEIDDLFDMANHEYFSQIGAANFASATGDFLSGLNPARSFERLQDLSSRLYGFSCDDMKDYINTIQEKLQETSDLFSTDVSRLASTSELLARAMEQLTNICSSLQEECHTANQQSEGLKKKINDLEKRVCMDSLTQVYSRVYFSERLRQRLKDSAVSPHTFAILFADIDGFKRINDTLGHIVGDHILRQVAQAIRSCVRSGDVVARFGGDEFVILLDAPDVSQVEQIAKDIHRRVSCAEITHAGETVAVNVSVGGIFVSDPLDPYGTDYLEQLVELADRTMYAVKERGDNKPKVQEVAMKSLGSGRASRFVTHGRIPATHNAPALAPNGISGVLRKD